MPNLIQSDSQIVIRQMKKDLKIYEELLDTYHAVAVYEKDKKNGKLKNLKSLTDLM